MQDRHVTDDILSVKSFFLNRQNQNRLSILAVRRGHDAVLVLRRVPAVAAQDAAGVPSTKQGSSANSTLTVSVPVLPPWGFAASGCSEKADTAATAKPSPADAAYLAKAEPADAKGTVDLRQRDALIV